MDLESINIGQIFDNISTVIVALGTIFATIYASSKKFRSWINKKLKDTDTVQDLTKRQDNCDKKAKQLESHCQQRSTEIDALCNKIDTMLGKLDDKIDKLGTTVDNMEDKVNRLETTVSKMEQKVEKDKESTILTLKYQILDICGRADRYGCITKVDKSLLCELYHEYVEVWKQNHYVKSEADRVINSLPTVDKYENSRV